MSDDPKNYRELERSPAIAENGPVHGPGELLADGVVDEADAVRRMGGDRELFREAIELFLKDARKRLNILREEMERSDWTQFVQSTHRMKGAAASLSALGVQRATSELEERGKAGDLAGARIGFENLLCEFEKVERFGLARFGIKGRGS